jgi:hypothetical protein
VELCVWLHVVTGKCLTCFLRAYGEHSVLSSLDFSLILEMPQNMKIIMYTPYKNTSTVTHTQPNKSILYYITLNYVTLHHITSHYIISNHIIYINRIIRITLHCIALLYILYYIILYYID